MSFAGLSIGHSALTAAQRAVETAAHNVANANTAGFTRQRLAVQTSLPTPGTLSLRGDGMRGNGVHVLAVDRLRDRLADVAFRSEAGTTGQATARAATLGRAESVLGPYAEGSPEAFSRFLASWDQLTLTPRDPAARQSVVDAGSALASSLRGSAEQLDAVTREVGLRVGDQVGELNGLLESVGKLNLAIKDAEIVAQSPNDLYDQRDLALDRITSLTGARVVVTPEGYSNVELGGVEIVAGGSHTSLRAGTDDDGRPTLFLQDDGDTEVTLSVGGELGGYVRAVRIDLRQYSDQLDTLATGLRDAVNAVHARGFALDGSPGGDFFTGNGARDLAVDGALLATPGGLAASRTGKGDGDNALAMGSLRTTATGSGNTVAEGLRAFGARVGQAASDATRNAKTAGLGLAGAEQTRAAVNGVNVDEEMVDLVKYQHQYSAAAKVISVVDEMIQRIIDRLGS